MERSEKCNKSTAERVMLGAAATSGLSSISIENKHSGEKLKEHQTLHSAQTRRAVQLAARSMLWSILDRGALELIRARTTEAGDQVEQPKN